MILKENSVSTGEMGAVAPSPPLFPNLELAFLSNPVSAFKLAGYATAILKTLQYFYTHSECRT